MLFYYAVLFRYCCNITSSANSRKIFIIIMARKRKSKLKGIKKGTATDYGKDTENEVSINETLKTGADNVNENSERHEVETTELNKERNKRRKNTKVTEKTTSDQLNCTVDNGHEKKPEPEKQHDRAHAAMDTENEVPINETLKTGADNVNKDREGHEVETTELNKERNKRRKNTKVTEKTTSDQLNYAVDNGHEKKPEDEKQHDKAHAVMDKENESPINETLKTGADNVNDSDREGYEVETTELNKKRNKRRKNTKVTAKTPSDQLNNAVDNGHEKKPEDKKQHDRAHAVMDKENESPINETLKTGADNVNENGKGHEVKTVVLNKQRNTKRRNSKVTAKTPSDQLNYAVNNGHAKKPEAEKQHDRAHAVMDTENEVSINETLKTGADNVNKDRERHEVETTELNKERNKRRKNTKVTEKTTSDQLNYAVDNGHEKQPEDEKQHDKAHAVMDKENESPINETLKTGADNVNDSNREGYEVESTELNKKRNKRRKNTKVTEKTPSDQLNYAVDNGHEKQPEDEKQHDKAHAVMDKENESPINETLKTGADNVNENGKGHEVKTVVLNKQRNTKRRNSKVTAKTPSDQLNYAVNNGHAKKPEAEKQHDRAHAVMDTENEVSINETLKTGADNVNKDREGHEVETTELNKERNKRRKNTKVTEKTTSDQLNYAVDNGHEKKPEDEKQHDKAHAVMDKENESPINETLKTGADNVNDSDREGYEVETTELNKKRNKRRKNTKVTAKTPSDQLNNAVDNGHEKKPEDEKNRDRAHAVMDKETLKTGVDNVNGNGKGHEVETIELKKKRNTEMTVKAASDQLNYATDNDHEKKPEDEKHYRTHAVMDTESESPINETLKTGADNVNEDGKGHEVEIVELNTKRRNNKVTAKALSNQLNYAMDNGHEKEPEAQKQHDRTHAGMNTEKEAPTKETLKTGPVTDNKNRKGHMNEVEATQSNKKRNTEATAKAPLASYQLNYAAQQDKSQAKVKGQGTNKGLDEKIKEWREVLKMVEEDEEDSVYSKTPPTKISSNGLHGGRGELGEASLNVEFNAQSELLLVGQLLGLPLLADSAKRSLKYIQQVYMMQHGGRLESNILTEADIANSATQFLVDIQLMPFAPSLGDFLPPPDPNSYVLQTDDVTKKVTK